MWRMKCGAVGVRQDLLQPASYHCTVTCGDIRISTINTQSHERATWCHAWIHYLMRLWILVYLMRLWILDYLMRLWILDCLMRLWILLSWDLAKNLTCGQMEYILWHSGNNVRFVCLWFIVGNCMLAVKPYVHSGDDNWLTSNPHSFHGICLSFLCSVYVRNSHQGLPK